MATTEDVYRASQAQPPAAPNTQLPIVGPTGEEYIPPAPSWLTPQSIGRFAAEMGGSAALTALAPQIGLPLQAARVLGPAAMRGITTILPKMIGSGAGAGAGSAVSETFDPTADPLATATQATKLGVIGEGVGRGLGSAAQYLTKPNLQPGALQAQRLLNEHGASLTSGQATKSKLVDVLENVSEAGFLRTGTQKIKEQGESTASSIIDDIVKRYGSQGTTREAGAEVQSALTGRVQAWKDQGRQLYENIDQLVKEHPVPVDIRAIKTEARRLRGQHVLKDPQTSALLEQITGNSQKNIPAMLDQVPFGMAQRLRSELLSIGGDPTAMIKGRRENVAKILAMETDTAMEAASKRLNPQAYEAWRKASAHWKGSKGELGAGILEDPVLVKAMTDDPGIVLDSLLKSGKLDSFTTVMKLLPQPVADGVRREFLERAVTSATRVPEGQVVGKVSGADLGGKVGLEKPFSGEAAAFRGLFGAKEADEIQTAVHALRLTQNQPTDRMFTFIVRGSQIGGLTALMTGTLGRGLGATVLIAPHAAAWLINNPVSRRLLIRGAELPVGTPAATAVAAKLLAFAQRSGIPVTGGSEQGKPGLADRAMSSFKVPHAPSLEQGQAEPVQR